MDRLQEQFGDQVDFVLLDADDPTVEPLRAQFDIRGRSQYVLVGADGEVITRWFGPIGFAEETIAAEIEKAITEVRN